MISYEPLWKTLEIKGYSTYWLLNHGVDSKTEYYGAAEPPVRCGESHLSGLTEPPQFVY